MLSTHKLDALGVTEAEVTKEELLVLIPGYKFYVDSACEKEGRRSRTLWIIRDKIKVKENNLLTSARQPQTWIEATLGSQKVLLGIFIMNGKAKMKKL